ncbi:MAG: epoxyqueuosine reductase QueH [Chloroflexota bacterium]|nr:epoxyqueuosine reductase QueH [Chloroflexota bacterium]
MKVVLHVCCGVCASSVSERLIDEGHELIGFFYNPNIHPVNEYKRRLQSADKVARLLRFPLVEDSYDQERWLLQASSLESEPEGGKRCELCFQLRLERTYKYLVDSGWDIFTTTLTCSPHKSAEVVNRVGQSIGGDRFLIRDFKKESGFNRSIQMAKQWKLYRQKYCGCKYSIR